MKSKFYNDKQNEEVIHKLMVKHWLYKLLEKKGFKFFEEVDNRFEQKLWIDFKCIFDWNIVNIDEKTRFTIPLYENKIKYTFALEISNSSSKKIGWFIDKNKMTDYYLLNYPILDKEIWKNNRNYKINYDWSIEWIVNNVNWVVSQLVSVEKLRKYFSNRIDKQDLVNFIKSFYTENINRGWIEYYNLKFQKIKKTDRWDIYFTYNNFLKERPINLIVNQKVYDKIREFELYIHFKK